MAKVWKNGKGRADLLCEILLQTPIVKEEPAGRFHQEKYLKNEFEKIGCSQLPPKKGE